MILGLGLGLSRSRNITLPAYQSSGAFTANNPPWFNAGEGTFIIEFTDSLSNTATDVVFSLNDGSNSNRIEWLHGAYASDGRALQVAQVGGANLINHNIPKTVRLAGLSKLGVSYKNGDIVYYYNGVPIARNVSQEIPPLSRIGIGRRATGGLDFDGTIISTQYYNRKMPDDFIRGQTRNFVPDISASYDGNLNIVLFAGQSNSSGRAVAHPSYTHPVAQRKYISNAGVLGDYSDPYDTYSSALFPALNDTSAGGSYAGVVLDELVGAQGGTWAAAPANLGGTPVVGTNNGWAFQHQSGAVGERKTSPLSYALYQHSLMAQQHGKIRALIWHQGESDALNITSETDFKSAMTNLLSFYRLQFDCPIVVVSLHKWHAAAGMGTQSDWDNVRTWQSEVVQSLPYTHFIDLSDLDGNPADRIHLDLSANITAGSRIAAALNLVL